MAQLKKCNCSDETEESTIHRLMVHKPNVRPFFGPKVSHFLKVRTAELLTA
jgi:hypothetical protein